MERFIAVQILRKKDREMTELTEASVREEARAWLEANWDPNLGLVEWRLQNGRSDADGSPTRGLIAGIVIWVDGSTLTAAGHRRIQRAGGSVHPGR